ncbi:uncharacterized protein [Diadema antillarum]|uniref:uncharacterized protein n=1 Tax=Diadema antillarum TaxID=105358 RepID=UPI003A86FAA3
MKAHVNKLCSSAIGILREIGNIRLYLTTTERLVHAFVTSRLDSCNAVLVNLPETEIKRLQPVQNVAARIVTKARKQQHTTPLLSTLHWLPIYLRIEFRMLLPVFKSLNGSTPSYISELLHGEEVLSDMNAFLLPVRRRPDGAVLPEFLLTIMVTDVPCFGTAIVAED